MGALAAAAPPSETPMPDSDELALLQFIDRRLRALGAEEAELLALRGRLVDRIRQQEAAHGRAA